MNLSKSENMVKNPKQFVEYFKRFVELKKVIKLQPLIFFKIIQQTKKKLYGTINNIIIFNISKNHSRKIILLSIIL